MTSPAPLRLKEMVRITLSDNLSFNGISARNSDISLMILIWQRWYSVGTNPDSIIHLQRLYDLPSQENVKRWRAKYQNDMGLYVPTDWRVAKARGWLRAKWEKALGYTVEPEEKQVVEADQKRIAEIKAIKSETLFEIEPIKPPRRRPD